MTSFPYETVDVFTDRPFGGNQLAVFTDARGLSDAQMQSLAAEMNYSETTFVLPPDDPANDDRNGVLRFEQMAGLVEIAVERDAAGAVTGAVIAAPQALSLGIELPVDGIAACAGVAASDIVTSRHKPVQASLGVRFVLAQVTPAALTGATPDITAFRKLEGQNPELQGRLSLFLYARDGNAIRARMFAPLAGTWEDPATGSASATLGALLLSLDGGDEAAYSITQGVEMGRPSLLNVTSRRAADGIRSRVGGGCVPMFRGEALL